MSLSSEEAVGEGVVGRARRPVGRRWTALALAAMLAVLAVVGVRQLTREGSNDLVWSPAAIGSALHGRLAGKGLNVLGVQCVTPRDGATLYAGTRVLRCGVNFGDPHMPVYCATIVDGALVTDRQEADLRC